MSDANTVFDFNLFGQADDTGAVDQVWGKEAVENALLMWIVSSKGEILHQPQSGGYLIPYLTKIMSDDNADELRNAIDQGLYEDFRPYIKVKTLEVVPDYSNRLWTIKLEGYCDYIKTNVEVDTRIKNLV